LLRDADVFVQGYRPGAIAAFGFGPQEVARIRPGIVYVSLCAYGHEGAWASRRGFDSLVQTASGFNAAEAEAFGAKEPKPLPAQALDHATGYLMAFAAISALARRARLGGSWHVRTSLAQAGLLDPPTRTDRRHDLSRSPLRGRGRSPGRCPVRIRPADCRAPRRGHGGNAAALAAAIRSARHARAGLAAVVAIVIRAFQLPVFSRTGS